MNHVSGDAVDDQAYSRCNFRVNPGQDDIAQCNTHSDDEKKSDNIDHGLKAK